MLSFGPQGGALGWNLEKWSLVEALRSLQRALWGLFPSLCFLAEGLSNGFDCALL